MEGKKNDGKMKNNVFGIHQNEDIKTKSWLTLLK